MRLCGKLPALSSPSSASTEASAHYSKHTAKPSTLSGALIGFSLFSLSSQLVEKRREKKSGAANLRQILLVLATHSHCSSCPTLHEEAALVSWGARLRLRPE